MRGHASQITGSAGPARPKGGRSSRVIRALSLIGLIAVLALAFWTTPSAAMGRVHGPDARAAMTQAAPDQAAHDCRAHRDPAQAGCCGMACSPGVALPPAPALLAGLRPRPPRPDRAAPGASRTPEILSPPPKP